MTMLKIFKSRLPRISYIFEDGTVAVFAPRTNHTQGHYLTSEESKIAELTKVANGNRHPHIFIDPDDIEVDEADADPAVAFRNRIRDEERAKLIAELGDPNQMQAASNVILPESLVKKDLGTTEAKATLGGIGNSISIAGTAAESNAKA